MARIKAFHSTPAWSMESVLQDGFISPQVNRLNANYWIENCDRWLEDLKYDIGWGEILGSHESIEAVRQLVSGNLEGADAEQATSTEFQCLDLLAGDLDCVFLQVGKWPDWMRREKVGFSFDAVQLIREGAFLRRKDIIRNYHLVVERALRTWVPGDTVRSAKKRIVDGLERVRSRYTHSGAVAIRLLSEVAATGKAELLYPGDLPVDAAVEVFS
jgi:hypothetical protein